MLDARCPFIARYYMKCGLLYCVVLVAIVHVILLQAIQDIQRPQVLVYVTGSMSWWGTVDNIERQVMKFVYTK